MGNEALIESIIGLCVGSFIGLTVVNVIILSVNIKLYTEILKSAVIKQIGK